MSGQVARFVLINGSLILIEKSIPYIAPYAIRGLQRFGLFKNTTNQTDNIEQPTKSIDEDENDEQELCPICHKDLKNNLENVEFNDIDEGIFILPKCGHKYHFSCLKRLRLVYKKCALCELDIIPSII